MSTVVQNSTNTATKNSNTNAAIAAASAVAATAAIQQLSSISLMMEYDIDNTFNTIKEDGAGLTKSKAMTTEKMDIIEQSTSGNKFEEIDGNLIKMKATISYGKEPMKIRSEVNLCRPLPPAIDSDLSLSNSYDNFKTASLPTPPATPSPSTSRERWWSFTNLLRKESVGNISSNESQEYEVTTTMSDTKKDGLMFQKRSSEKSSSLDSIKESKGFVENQTSELYPSISPEIHELKYHKDSKTAILPTPPHTPCTQNTARKRWKILAKVLRKDSEETVSSSGGEECAEDQTASVRRFKSFDLLRQDSFEDHVTLNCLGKPENWYKYRLLKDDNSNVEYSVNIHHMERQLTASDLMGFNNTGNICVWPSEEALTAYVLSDLNIFHGKWILELGGGFTCLAGLMLSKYAKPFAVHLTDGNEVSIENVKKSVCLNELSCFTKCSVLKWEDKSARIPNEAGKFDFILSADCLFFDEARTHLVKVIWYFLSERGEALVMAPKRGKTMEEFIIECRNVGFLVDIEFKYNETIWKRHLELQQQSDLYDEDLHYPVLLRLTKRRCGGEDEQSVGSGNYIQSSVTATQGFYYKSRNGRNPWENFSYT